MSCDWRASRLLRFVLALWVAFVAWGVFYSLLEPMWDGFDEPFHLAYAEFVAVHHRPPHFGEPALPDYYLRTNKYLPSTVGYGAPSFGVWREYSDAQRRRLRGAAAASHVFGSQRPTYVGENYERQQGPAFYYLAAPFLLLFRGQPLAVALIAGG